MTRRGETGSWRRQVWTGGFSPQGGEALAPRRWHRDAGTEARAPKHGHRGAGTEAWAPRRWHRDAGTEAAGSDAEGVGANRRGSLEKEQAGQDKDQMTRHGHGQMVRRRRRRHHGDCATQSEAERLSSRGAANDEKSDSLPQIYRYPTRQPSLSLSLPLSLPLSLSLSLPPSLVLSQRAAHKASRCIAQSFDVKSQASADTPSLKGGRPRRAKDPRRLQKESLHCTQVIPHVLNHDHPVRVRIEGHGDKTAAWHG